MLHRSNTSGGAPTITALAQWTDDQLLDEVAVGQVLTQSLSKLRRLRATGEGPPVLKIGKSVRYRVGDLRRWLESLVTPKVG